MLTHTKTKKKTENISDWENVSGMPKTETDVVDARRCTEKPIKKKTKSVHTHKIVSRTEKKLWNWEKNGTHKRAKMKNKTKHIK